MEREIDWRRIDDEVRAKYEGSALGSLITVSGRQRTFTTFEIYADLEMTNDYAKDAVDAVLRRAREAGKIESLGNGRWTVIRSV